MGEMVNVGMLLDFIICQVFWDLHVSGLVSGWRAKYDVVDRLTGIID